MEKNSCSSSLDAMDCKVEPECIFNEQVHVKEELVECLKEEAEWEDSTAHLYAGHEVKDELVLGPVGPQPRDIAFTLYGSFLQVQFTRMHIFELWSNFKGSNKEKTQQVLEEILKNVPENKSFNTETLINRITYLTTTLIAFWKKSNRTRENLIRINAKWLAFLETIELVQISDALSERENCTSNIGCPLKDYGTCSKRQQQRRLAELSKIDESAVSALMGTSSVPGSDRCEVDPNETLSFITQNKLTKQQYLNTMKFINSKPNPVLPSYSKILEAKKQCYPDKISIKESCAEVDLQSLLDHTANRLLESQNSVMSNVDPESLGEVTLIGKWGFDGSTGHSEYKQCFTTDPTLEDGSLFVTSYVPLRLVSIVATTGEETLLWKNPRPSSTRYCRPIRFQFVKETKELSKSEETYFKNQIDKLLPTMCMLPCGEELAVHHQLQLTMVDGKICNALSDTASATRCYMCKATPKDMNQIDMCLDKDVDTTTLEFGLSPLHARIRFFEYLLHVSYRLEVKKWQVRTTEEKEKLAERKKTIQSEFKKKLGLVVDKPRSGGSGNSNDGNTARKFFDKSDVAAEITGIRQDLIDRCATILNCINSGYKIKVDRFKEFCLDTARQLVQEFPWYNLPASVHKVLIHGAEVIDNMLVSIGELSEEAAESTNKNIKAFRLRNTRKMSRELTNQDLLNRLLLNSDPLISSLRKLPLKKKTILSQSVISLLEV